MTDKTILGGMSPACFFTRDTMNKFIGKMCYFGENRSDFDNLNDMSKLEKGKLKDVDYEDPCFIKERSSSFDFNYRFDYCLPCEWVVDKIDYTDDAYEAIIRSNLSEKDKDETIEKIRESFMKTHKFFSKENLEYLKKKLALVKPDKEKFPVIVVKELPTENIKENTIYVLQDSYIYRNGEWISVEPDSVKSLDKCIEECKDLSILKYLNELKELKETK